MIVKYKCRLCGSVDTEQILNLQRVPPDVQALLTAEQLGQDSAINFTVYQCTHCGLVQSPVRLKVDYYDDYLMSTTFSQQLTDYLDNLVSEFTNKYNVRNGRVLDIGAGDGAFMHPFKKRGFEVVGIEPSQRSRTVAEQSGFTVYPGYVESDTVVPGGPYDVFVSRQVLEHVNDIKGVLAGISNNLKPGGYGIIEVPSLEKAIKDSRFYDFFPDHVNYYSLETLSLTMELNGFRVLEKLHTMYDEYNVVVVQKRSMLDLSAMSSDRTILIDSINELFKDAKQDGMTTAVWGSGAKGLSILSNLDVSLIDHLVDSDVNKQGRYTAISELLIEPAEIIKQTDVGVLLITAVAYQTVILQKLKNYQYRGRVFVLERSSIRQVEL